MPNYANAYPRLLADVGGTNIRFATQFAGKYIGPVTTWAVSDFASPEEAIRMYLRSERIMPLHAAIGVANPVTGDRIKLTNHDWTCSIAAMRRSLGLNNLLVINDFTALALALPEIGETACVRVRDGHQEERAPQAVIGPGTGLGISGVVPSPKGCGIPLAGEGGHMEITPLTDNEWIAWRAMQQQYGRVSAERLLCGAGLSQIHAALSAAKGLPMHALLSPERIMENALHRDDALCQQTFEVFCGLLGATAASVALLLGARGGVYIGGGIVPRYIEPFMQSGFQERFTSVGRLREYMTDIPVFVITAQHPAMHGLRHALDEVMQTGSWCHSGGHFSCVPCLSPIGDAT